MEIDRNNRILLSKITKIISSSNSRFRNNTYDVYKKSLNISIRKDSHKNIASENLFFLKRLQQKKSYFAEKNSYYNI